MATIHNFQDLEVWTASKDLSIKVFKIFRRNNNPYESALIRQMIRAVVSIPSNIAEGFDREGNKEFLQFLSIAKGSNAEFLTQLVIAFECGMIEKSEFDQITNTSKTISYMIKKLMTYLSKSTYKGQKFVLSNKKNQDNEI